MSESIKVIVFSGLQAKSGGVDLNCEQVQSPRFPLGDGHVHRQDDVRAAHGFSALDDLYSE
jgi:hypothetical protein